MAHHDLKCHPHFFAAIVEGKKTFEIRRNDRAYRVGDTMTLKEYDPSLGHTGKETGPFDVVYLMTAEDFPAILPGFVIMGLGGLPETITVRLEAEDVAKTVGEVVAELPVTKMLERCNEYRKVAGLVIPRTCAKCGLGPCQHPER